MSTTKDDALLRSKFIELCKQRKALMYGEFVLNCGVTSHIFFNSGNLTDAESFGVLCELLANLLIDSGLEFDSIVGLPYKGIPLASGVCSKYFEKTGRNTTFGYHRKEIKDHGEGSLLVGAPGTFDKGTKIVVLDDVLTTGKALNKALDLFQSVDVKIVAFVVIVNREVNYGDVNRRLSAHGICVKELFRLEQLDPNYKSDSATNMNGSTQYLESRCTSVYISVHILPHSDKDSTAFCLVQEIVLDRQYLLLFG